MSIDLEKLLKLRLVVAHFGEMDLARWWNTKAQLGLLGKLCTGGCAERLAESGHDNRPN